MCSQRPHLQCGDRHLKIVLRAGWGGKMHDRIQLAVDMQVVAHVVFHEAEFRITDQVSDVFGSPCDQVVQSDNLMTLSNQEIGQVATQKSCAACNQNSHESLPPSSLPSRY
ncbi:hypothetical protein NSPZN2_90021 [Nitrospira defluvii]|uniref:Uncharacterized protein n=1 Tax=Nitrospira defluvii TaxID=330214 RepID=A0ABM8SEG2_9BACT|nr:hypothetical protein NSPZN2_90021 [Nitrospira defluvii]